MAVQSKLVPYVQTAASRLTTFYLGHRTAISRTVYLALLVTLIRRLRGAIGEQKASSARMDSRRNRRQHNHMDHHHDPLTDNANSGDDGARDDTSGGPSTSSSKRVEVNAEFVTSLLRLLRIVIPGWKSREARLLVSHSVFLVVRTLLSVYVAELDGRLVSSLVRGRGREFLLSLVWWMAISVPATFTNSMVSGLVDGGRDTDDASSAVVPPGRAGATVPAAADGLHPQQISVEHDVLYAFGTG